MKITKCKYIKYDITEFKKKCKFGVSEKQLWETIKSYSKSLNQ